MTTIPMHRNRKRPFEHEKARAVDAKFATAISAGPTPSQPLQPSNPRVPSVQAEQGLLMCAASLLQTSQSYRQTVQKMPAFQRESEGLPSWVLQHTAMPLTFERSRTSVAATPFVLPPRAALPAPGGTQQAPLPSPGWPSCSTERQRLPSDDDSSPRGQQQHVLASDVQEAVLSGGRLSLNLESLLFLPAAASGNAAAAVRNRKTELDMCVPSVPAKAVIQAFEGLRGALVRSGNEQHAVLMQEGWTALLGRALTGAGTMQAGLGTGLALHPELLTHALSEARAALYACARQADSALAPLSPQAAALAILEAMHRFAVRSVLPFLPAGGLFSFPWLEHAVWQLHPSLRPLSSPQGSLPELSPGHTHLAVSGVLQRLGTVHQVLEEALRAASEEQRQAASRCVLLAAGTAVLADHMQPAAAEEHRQMRALRSMPGVGAASAPVEAALQAAALLRGDPAQLSAVAEVMERGARLMSLPPEAFTQALWALLSSLAK
ncbi:hypothetical protein D9Q98_008406 [Chlorella vulgaris]|uniref:Uncharacterized protein n=1 Tax=Chlorella vulgaris TaxID=3077 RepID=A0A9D4TGP8_CHLVU|nr:hypothetical protein D9Q98_008406 [Chlorella vulgaris]